MIPLLTIMLEGRVATYPDAQSPLQFTSDNIDNIDKNHA